MNIQKIATAAAFTAFAGLAQAVPITGLVNTGAGLAEGAQDNNYVLTVAGSSTSLLGGGPNAGYVSSTNIHPWWLYPSASSAWLTPFLNAQQTLDPVVNNNASDNGIYTWTLSFNLDQYFSTAALAGRFAFDNMGAVFLNGVQLASGIDGYAGWTDFSANTALFQAGANTLTFVVTNTAQNENNPTGLRVEIMSSNVPEPESYALLLGGLGLLGFISRRRQQK